jgi:proton-translocating NADH-quinone oxidoreductase chain L
MDRIPSLLLTAWLLPLVSFAIISIGYSVPQFFGIRVRYTTQKYASYVAVGAIVLGCVLSMIAMFGYWLPNNPLKSAEEHESHAEHTAATYAPARTVRPMKLVALESENDDKPTQTEPTETERNTDHSNAPPTSLTGDWYTLGQFGKLRLTIGYYIDTLTVTMFCMVTLIASCVHIYAVGYMSDELQDYVDHEVHLPNHEHLHRRGRFHRFFQYLSLFSFSMLGICISGNLLMTFIFWELVGICSYFLIGFYIERHSASTAANKAFIVNRVGDFGMLIGLMIIWSTIGTFNFGDMKDTDGTIRPGVFSQLRTKDRNFELAPADGMIAFEARKQIAELVRNGGDDAAVNNLITNLRGDTTAHWGQWALLIAGVGLFCGCMGKSAQVPLHVWLPDAMEGPTPVSALVHSATMVAAGVFLVGRIYPLLSPEALLVVATIGCITLILAASIALTAVDIKRVLAYSTISQLGYMMLALGLGGWVAGLFHLITHAFFKSLLFLCSGSVIHAVHTNDMRQMGGLRHKMPVTAYTMLAGCLAISGIGIPFVLGFSGFHSKDAIIEQSLHFARTNGGAHPLMWLFVVIPLVGAAITSFYMFRLWYMTFAGTPRDHHRYDHAHESPPVMANMLIVLSIFAVCAGWWLPHWLPARFANFGVEALLEQARPIGILGNKPGVLLSTLIIPDEHASHDRAVKIPAGISAILVALAGVIGATIVYLWESISAASLRRSLSLLYAATWNKWWFDELYDYTFVRPTRMISAFIAFVLDRRIIDGIIHLLAYIFRGFAQVVSIGGDRYLIDNGVDTFAEKTWDLGLWLRTLQTGRLRQYVMFIVVGTIVLFVVASLWWKLAV